MSLAQLAQEGYGHQGSVDLSVLGAMEFSSLRHPFFFLCFTPDRKIAGYLAFDTIEKQQRGDSDAYWEYLLSVYPGLETIYMQDRSLLIAIVSGIVIAPEHRKSGLAQSLMHHAISQIQPLADIIIGLTKNPSAISLRAKIISQLNESPVHDSYALWAGIHQLIGTKAYEQVLPIVQTFARLYVGLELSGTLFSESGVCVIPPVIDENQFSQPYLPAAFPYQFDQLREEARVWLEPLYAMQETLSQGNVALVPLIAISERVLAAILSKPAGEPTSAQSDTGHRVRQARLVLSPKQDQ